MTNSLPNITATDAYTYYHGISPQPTLDDLSDESPNIQQLFTLAALTGKLAKTNHILEQISAMTELAKLIDTNQQPIKVLDHPMAMFYAGLFKEFYYPNFKPSVYLDQFADRINRYILSGLFVPANYADEYTKLVSANDMIQQELKQSTKIGSLPILVATHSFGTHNGYYGIRSSLGHLIHNRVAKLIVSTSTDTSANHRGARFFILGSSNSVRNHFGPAAYLYMLDKLTKSQLLNGKTLVPVMIDVAQQVDYSYGVFAISSDDTFTHKECVNIAKLLDSIRLN